jgi:hypothetical protein
MWMCRSLLSVVFKKQKFWIRNSIYLHYLYTFLPRNFCLQVVVHKIYDYYYMEKNFACHIVVRKSMIRLWPKNVPFLFLSA